MEELYNINEEMLEEDGKGETKPSLHQLPLTQENIWHEMDTIFQIAKKNEYPLVIINQLNEKIMNKKQRQLRTLYRPNNTING